MLLSNNHFSWSAGSLKGLHAEILLHIFIMSRNSRINICLWKVLGKGLRVNYYGYISVEWKIRISHSLYCLCLDYYLPCCSRTLRGSRQSSSVAFRCVDASIQIEENITVSLRTKHCLNSEPSIRCAGYKISKFFYALRAYNSWCLSSISIRESHSCHSILFNLLVFFSFFTRAWNCFEIFNSV